MPLYIAQSGDLDRCYRCLTDWLTDSQMKDRATQLLIKYKSGALVTQWKISFEDRIRGASIQDDMAAEYIYIWKVIAVFYFYGICRNCFTWSILDIWPTLWVVSFENNYFENDQNVQFLAERAVHGKTARERFFRLSGVETSSSFRPVVTVNS